MQTILWMEWCKAFSVLRTSFSRQTTYWWAMLYCAGLTITQGFRGVSSIVDQLGLSSASYHSLLRLAQSNSIDLDKLTDCWINACLSLFRPVCVDGYLVAIGDGIKVAKEGKKMPAVKLMHQSSQSNSKAEFIMGHYFQSLSLLVNAPNQAVAAIPLIARIHDGLVYSNRSQATVMTRMNDIVSKIADCSQVPTMLVADAYYANAAIIQGLDEHGCHLVSRVAHNTVAYEPAPQPKERKRGRPRLKGAKIKLRDLFEQLGHQALEEGVRYIVRNLYWSPAKRIIRFVVVENEKRGKVILMSTKTDLDPITIIRLYESRWLIESGYKTAIHNIGTFSYHFWMKGMKVTKRTTKTYLHRETAAYRAKVNRKLKAFHTHLALGCIAQGLLQHLSINFSSDVWNSFSGWLRTIRNDLNPSEIVVSNALRTTFPNFFIAAGRHCEWRKFILKRLCGNRTGVQAQVANWE